MVRWPVFVSLMILLLHASQVLASLDAKNQREEVIQTLEYIANGYENSVPRDVPLHLQGRIFFEQRAQEGKEIPENNRFAPKWLQFDYLEQAGKRRYEQDRHEMPGQRYYVLDNNQRVTSYATNVVRIYPIKNKESTWVQKTNLYGDFLQSSRFPGEETLSLVMKNLAAAVKAGHFDAGDRDLVVDVNEGGLISVRARYDKDTCRWAVDPRKGFGMVAYEEHRPSEEFYVDKHQECEYERLSSGAWVLAKAKIFAISNGVIVDKRLETTEIKEGVKVPDSLFELESLKVPPDIYTVDYSFSPPLTIRKGPMDANILQLDPLLTTPVATNQLATVDSNGQVKVGEHRAYIQDERTMASGNPGGVTLGRRALLPFVGIGVGACVIGLALLRRMRIRHRHRKG